MEYTLKIAEDDYSALSLEKSGNKYLITVYVFGYKMTYKKEFSTYDEANKRYLEMCENSHVEPITIKHDPWELLVNAN